MLAVVQGVLMPEVQAAYLEALLPFDGRLVQLVATPDESGVKGSVFSVFETQSLLGPWLRAAQQRVAVVRADHYVYGTAVDPEHGLGLLRAMHARLH
ncbi:MAG: hypothetical protein CBB60_003685 [Armatimonadetes bacterium Cent15-Ar3]|nr:MAG: hypothetical protein CBB60_003685 [Armatimonadetes bacterium Cent15-Ar3]